MQAHPTVVVRSLLKIMVKIVLSQFLALCIPRAVGGCEGVDDKSQFEASAA